MSQNPSPTDYLDEAVDWGAIWWRERTSSGIWSHEFAAPISVGSVTADARQDIALRLYIHWMVDLLPTHVVSRLYEDIRDSLLVLQVPALPPKRTIRSRVITRNVAPRPEFEPEE